MLKFPFVAYIVINKKTIKNSQKIETNKTIKRKRNYENLLKLPLKPYI